MKNKNFAVLGSAHGHIKEFIEVMLKKGGNFVGIYDDGSSLCKEFKNEYSVPLYKKLDDIFAQNLDIAGTSAVNNQKIDIIEECSRQGVHIIADKPIVVNHNQFETFKNIINKKKIEIGLMLTLRFDPCVSKVKKLLNENVIGRLLSVEIFSPHTLRKNTRPDWHFDKEQNGGIIIDLMVHSVDLYNWFTESDIIDYHGVVQKSILKEKEDFYDNCQFFLESQSGASGYLRVDWHMPENHWSWGDIRIFCTGTKGSLEARVTGDPITRESQIILFEKGEKTRKIDIKDEVQASVIDDFLKRVNGEESLIDHQDIVEATGLSIDFDRTVKKVNLLES